MIEPTGYRARCDQTGCAARTRGATVAELVERGEAVGWTFNVRADGTPARRNGKDYCPVHRRRWHLLDDLTETMAARLVVLLKSPVWRPHGAGQWRSARLMHGRRLLTRITGTEGEYFELNDAGRRAALDVRDRLREAAIAVQPAEGGGGA